MNDEGDYSSTYERDMLRALLDEMELLETAYPEVVVDAPDPRPHLRAALEAEQRIPRQLESGSSGSPRGRKGRGCEESGGWLPEEALYDGDSIPQLSFRCPLSLGHGHLRVRLPRWYPEKPLVANVEGTPQLPARTREAITAAARDEARRLSGETRREPHCLQVLGEALRVSSEHADAIAKAKATSAAPVTASGETRDSCGLESECSSAAPLPLPAKTRGCPSDEGHFREMPCCRGAEGKGADGRENATAVLLGRRLIYSHHIIATQKRTGIVRAARELELGGFSKVGWPGVIVVEGNESSCEEFVRTLRGWRWKHLAVRGEETVPVPLGRSLDEERLLPTPLEELGEKEGISAIAARCRKVGLGELFATLLR